MICAWAPKSIANERLYANGALPCVEASLATEGIRTDRALGAALLLVLHSAQAELQAVFHRPICAKVKDGVHMAAICVGKLVRRSRQQEGN